MSEKLGIAVVEAQLDDRPLRDGMARSEGETRSWAGGLGNIVNTAVGTAVGFLSSQVIMGGAKMLAGLAGEAFNAVAAHEKLGMSLETLVAREIKAASGIEKVVTVGQAQVSLSEKEQKELAKLKERYDDLSYSIPATEEKVKQYVSSGKHSDALNQEQIHRLNELKEEYGQVGARIAELTAKEGQTVPITQKVIEGQLTMAEAMGQAGPKAKELLNWIERLGIQSPFETDQIGAAFRLAMSYGFVTDEAQRLVAALTDFAAGTGQSDEVIKRVSLSLGQVRAAGKVTGMDLRELANAGVPVREILAKAFGVTTAQLGEMVTKGLIPADKAIEAIVKSMEEDFGGAAKRQATSLAGLQSSLKELKTISLRDLFTGVFETMQPYLASVVDLLSSDRFREGLRNLGETFGATLARTIETLRPFAMYIAAIVQDGDYLNDWLTQLPGPAQGVVRALGPVVDLVSDLLAAVTSGSPVQLVIFLNRLSDQLLVWLENAIPEWTDGLARLAIAAGRWVMDALPGLVAMLSIYRGQMLGALDSMLPTVLNALLRFVQALGGWALEALPGFLANMATFWQRGVEQLMSYLPGWIETLLKFGLAAITWIVEQLPGLAANLGQFFNRMVVWVVDNLPGWIAELQKLGLAAIQWVLDALPGLATNLGKMAGELIKWIAKTAIDVVPKLVVLAGRFLEWVATEVLPRLPGVLATILTAILRFIAGMLTAIDPEIGKVATGIVDGLEKGIRNAADKVAKALQWVVDQAIANIKRMLGIASPSELMAQIGADFIAGFLAGLDQKKIDLYMKVAELGSLIARAISDWLGAAQGLAAWDASDLSKKIDAFITQVTAAISKLAPALRTLHDTLLHGHETQIGATAQLISNIFSMAKGVAEAMKAITDQTKWPDLTAWKTWLIGAVQAVVDGINQATAKVGADALSQASALAEAIRNVLGVVATDFSRLALAETFPDLEEWGSRLVAVVMMATTAINLAASNLGANLKKASDLSQEIGAIMAVVNADFSGLALSETFPDLEEWGARLVVIVMTATRAINLAASGLGSALKAAADLAGQVGSVLGIVGGAVEGMLALGNMADVSPTVLLSNMATLTGFVDQFVTAISAIAVQMSTTAVTAMGEFGEAAAKVFAMGKAALDFLNGLAEFTGEYIFAQKITTLASMMGYMVEVMAWLAYQVSPALLTAATVFSLYAKLVFETLKTAVDFFNKLGDTVMPNADQIAAFVNAVKDVMQRLASISMSISLTASVSLPENLGLPGGTPPAPPAPPTWSTFAGRPESAGGHAGGASASSTAPKPIIDRLDLIIEGIAELVRQGGGNTLITARLQALEKVA